MNAPLRKTRPPIREMKVDPFDWNWLIPAFVHEVKVGIIEAMDWIGQPLSPSELESILGVRNWPLGTIAYHAKTLAALGIIEMKDERAVRGARETFYFFSSRS
jgi:hypothetical protein